MCCYKIFVSSFQYRNCGVSQGNRRNLWRWRCERSWWQPIASKEGKMVCKCADARKEAAHGRMNIRMQMSQGWFRRCILQQLRAPPLNQLSWVISVITNLSWARKEPKVYMGLKTSYTSISLKSSKRFLRARQVMTDHYHPYCLSLGCMASS